MKRFILSIFVALAALSGGAQSLDHYKKIIKELSSTKYQGRGYALNGVRKAGKYIAREFRRAGVDEVTLQPFCIDVNCYPGRMEMSVDGKKLAPGTEFTVREYCPGVDCSGKLYFIDEERYDSAKVLSDLAKPENEGCFVVCDYFFSTRHREDFSRMQSRGECLNAGVILTWTTPLKFYRAYSNLLIDKPVAWVMRDLIEGASEVRLSFENKYLKDYESDNVIAKVEGRRHDGCYVFTAHYDHLGNLGRKTCFPGANDNASGTAGIITLAEYYAQNTPEYDMYFIAFSGEDTNLNGSGYYVEHPVVPLSEIRYLFNLDMIGDDNPVIYCEVSDAGMDGYDELVRINSEKKCFAGLNRGELAGNSDHWPFAQKGVPCIFFENKEGSAFQYYHTVKDDFSTVRFESFEPLMTLIRTYCERLK